MSSYNSSDHTPRPFRVMIGPGEFYDRLGITRLKATRHPDVNIRDASLDFLAQLEAEEQHHGYLASCDDYLASLVGALNAINRRLWLAESKVRNIGTAKEAQAQYIRLSKLIYISNLHRSNIKNMIDLAVVGREIDYKHHTSSSSPSPLERFLKEATATIVFEDQAIFEPEYISLEQTASVESSSRSSSGFQSHNAISNKTSGGVRPVDEAKYVLGKLHATPIKVGVVSMHANVRSLYDRIAGCGYELSDFDVIVASDDVPRCASGSVRISAAVKALGVSPSRQILVGRSPDFVDWAKSAQVAQVVEVAGSSHEGNSYLKPGPKVILSSARELASSTDVRV